MIPDRLNTALADRYRIERELGAGGMATVYLAEDLKHDRKVAIKVLKPELAAVLGADRFVVEIKTTAALSHPHILPLFDSGTADGFLYYVMPFIKGETIREKLNRETQFGVEEAVRIAREVAEALDHAHRNGVIHRDIKPENILLHDGRAMVMDFGIALAVSAAAGGRMTETGLSLGTPHYMSPEQATADKEISGRSDIYSLASVLYEMLSGQPPHTGGSAQQVIMRILADTPRPVTDLRKSVPPNVAAAVAKALEKLPADRFDSAKAFAEALTSPLFTGVRSGGFAPSATERKTLLPWIIAAAALVASAGIAWRSATTESGSSASLVFASLDLEGVGLAGAGGHQFSVSPDGRNLALAVQRSDDAGLAVRAIDSVGVRFLPRTRGANHPFWSPDGKFIGFFADDSLRTIDVASGAVRTLCHAGGSHGGSWSSRDNLILFSGRFELRSTTPQPGSCRTLMPLTDDSSRSARPYFFPDGRNFVVTNDRQAWLGSLGSETLTPLTDVRRTEAVFVAPDYLLWRTDNGVLAQRIDVGNKELAGDPVRIMPGVSNPGGHPGISASATGLLVRSRLREVTPESGDSLTSGNQLALVDRSAMSLRLRPIPAGVWGALRYNRDGTQLALCGWHIQAMDVSSGLWTRIAGPAETGRETSSPALWSPRDTALFYIAGVTPPALRVQSFRTGATRTIPVRYSRVTRLPLRGALSYGDWSPDGQRILLDAGVPGQSSDAYEWEIGADSLRLLFDAARSVANLRYAPAGGWIAYEELDATSSDVYVRPYPGPGDPIRISTNGGRMPRWSARGTELFYLSAEGDVMVAQIQRAMTSPRGQPQVVVPRSVFAPRQIDEFDVAASGQQFAFILRSETPVLSLVVNWVQLLRKPLP
jgi:serine/threonine-protein kinase